MLNVKDREIVTNAYNRLTASHVFEDSVMDELKAAIEAHTIDNVLHWANAASELAKKIHYTYEYHLGKLCKRVWQHWEEDDDSGRVVWCSSTDGVTYIISDMAFEPPQPIAKYCMDKCGQIFKMRLTERIR